jgi:hypothetical protein
MLICLDISASDRSDTQEVPVTLNFHSRFGVTIVDSPYHCDNSTSHYDFFFHLCDKYFNSSAHKLSENLGGISKL